MITAPNVKVEDGGHFSADSTNSDDEQLDDSPFLSHQLPDDHESFSEKFLRNILTHDYQNLMPRRREKFVEITKTVTVTEIVNGAPDKHPSSCEVKVTNVSPAGPHPVNVSIKHLHEKWHSCEELENDLGKGTVIRIHETNKPFNCRDRSAYEDVVHSKVETEERPRRTSSSDRPRNMSSRAQLFNKSSDNIIDLEFRHPILVEKTSREEQKTSNGTNGSNGTRRRFADLRKRVSTTTKTSMTETEKVTTTRRSSSAHSTASRRSYGKPEVKTLYYRKFVDEETKPGGNDSESDSGSVIVHRESRESATKRSQSADPLISPVPPPRKRLGREESLHYYRDDEEVIGERMKSPEPGNTSVSMNDTLERRNITAGITSISMNNSCTDTSFESRFSTIPRARSPSSQRVNHIQVNVIGPIRTPEEERRRIPVGGMVGEDVTMDIHIEHNHGRTGARRVSASVDVPAPPKPPRRSKWEEHHIGEPIATSTPMTTIERKQTREERISVESGESSRKSTRSARPPDINIIECESFAFSRSPARTPATPIVVINQTPNSRRSSQDLLGEPGQRRRKSTVTDIDWYAAFNMKDPSSPTKIARPPFGGHDDVRKQSKDIRRRASDSSMIGIPPADIDLNQIFTCTSPEIKEDEKCQCNACRLIRMSHAERELRRQTRTRQSRSYTRTSEYETRSSTLPSRHRTAPVRIELDDIFNPKPSSPVVTSKPPTPPSRRRAPTFTAPPPPPSESSLVDESRPIRTIDRSQVTTTVTNSRDSQLLHDSRTQLLRSTPSGEDVDWVGHMMNDANEWEERRVSSRKASTASTVSGISGARKTSVARRISVDELTKPEKRKSREAVPLPPSDVSIDDIFTALTQKTSEKKEASSEEKKTFIITRKQRAQDVDAIDFEKDREPEPVAPPRSKKPEEAKVSAPQSDVTSTVHISLTPSASESSAINLDDVFTKNSSIGRVSDNSADQKIERRVAEFEKSQREKEMSRSEGVASSSTSHIRKTSLEDSNISMDDVFNPRKVEVVVPMVHEEPSTIPEKENVTSSASISLGDVFVEGTSSKKQNDTDEDEKIRRRVAESEKAKQEKEDQRKTVVTKASSSTRSLEDTNISMDDVFSSSEQQPRNEVSNASINLENVFDTDGLKKPESFEKQEDLEMKKRIAEFQRNEEEKATHLEVKEERPREKIFEDSDISVDDIFGRKKTSTSHMEPVEPEDVVEEEQRIEKRVAEFEKSKEEQEIHRVEEEKTSHHATVKIFEDSNISIDDVFSPPPAHRSSSSSITMIVKPKEMSSGTINLDNVFETENLKKPVPADEEEEKELQKRINEFKRNEAEKERQLELNKESPVIHEKIFEESRISIDDVFGGKKISTSQIQPVEPEDVVEEEKRIEKRVAEFERSEEEKEIRRVEEEKESHHTTQKIFEDSNISMDDVFSSPKSQTSSSSITMVVKPRESSSGSINLENVFDTDGLKKATPEGEAEEKEIRKRIDEFTRNEEEKDRKLQMTEEIHVEPKKLFDDSIISVDDIFAGTKPSTSDMQPVEAKDVVEEEQRIERRVAEFEKSKDEQEIHRVEEEKEAQHSREKIFEDSNISMDDVFNVSGSGSKSVVKNEEEASRTKTTTTTETTSEKSTRTVHTSPKSDDVTSSASITIKDAPSNEVINLDDVFVTGSASKSDVFDEEDKKIKRRIAEFERSKQEKEDQKTGVVTESTSSRRIFDESDISMDDVFAVPKKLESPNETQTVSLEKVFDVKDLKKPDDTDEQESVEIKKRMAEFKRNEEEKARQIQMHEESRVVHEKIFEDSSISVDDIFGGKEKTPSQVEPVEPKDVVEEEQRIEKRVAEFEKSKEEQEIHRVEEEKTVHHSTVKIFEDSDISMDDVFAPPPAHRSSSSAITMIVKPKETSSGSINLDNVFETENLKKPVPADKEEEKELQKRINEFKRNEAEKERQLELNKETPVTHEKIFEDSRISIDDVFGGRKISTSQIQPVEPEDVVEEEKRIEKRVAEFERSEEEKETRRVEEEKESHHSTQKIFDDSNISMDDVFSPRTPSNSTCPMSTGQKETSSASINLDNVFDTNNLKKRDQEGEAEDKEFRRRIDEFTRNEEEKERKLEMEREEVHSKHEKIFEDSIISVDDIFAGTKPSTSDVQPVKANDVPETTDETTTASFPRDETCQPSVTSSSHLNLDDIFVPGKSSDTGDNEEDLKIKRRIAEFKKSQQEKSQLQHQDTSSASRPHFFSDSNISLDDVFNASCSSKPEETVETPKPPVAPARSKPVFSNSDISLDDVFPSTIIKTSSETETTKTTTTTTTETTSESYSKRSRPTLDDLFGPQTPTAIPTVAISTEKEDVPPTAPLRPSKNLAHLQVPGKFNESMMSTTSTISLDDSFNNSFAVSQPKMRKELTLPVDNWIDSLVATATEEATREAPKTPKTPKHYPSPTRISQEIQYEWVADLVGVEEEKQEDVKSEEQHLQKQDSTWVSSVVYRPTLETSAYTLRASQVEPELDMDHVFNECLLRKKKDDEECECSACRLTEQELEEMKKRRIETTILKQKERASMESEPTERRNVEILTPSNFSIDDIFHIPLHVQTESIQIPSTSSEAQMPSTSSPPLKSTRTYYLSPKVSETVTTTHQWKDNDISMDEIFSPVSVASNGNDNRRFSNFYEDRSGWDTMGSEDSGVMSGGGRRRSSRIMDQVIDEAFKGIFESPIQPSTSGTTTKAEKRDSTQYDDYYITSLNQTEVESVDSEVDGENLDVTQFVDDILGKSMDEAAFLSSTKSLRDHTDTSIDRKKSTEKMHPYYRTRTDTSIDRRSKPAVISEETIEIQEPETGSHDEIMKLVFVDKTSLPSSASRGSLGRSQSRVKPNDEELLEIEIRPEYFLIRGSYSLLIPKSDPLGQMLQKLRDQNDSLATLDFSLTRKLKKLLVSCIREKAAGQMASSKYDGLSSRGQSLIESVDHASTTFLKMNVNKYLPETNPHGIVNFCTAENNICTPLLEERFKHLELFFPNTEHLARYPPSGGWPEAREVLVKYFKEFMGAKVNTEELVLTASTRTGYDVCSYCLFEQDDILLTNGPVYTGTISNVNERAQCIVECVETDLSNPRLEVKKYEEALEAQLSQDNTVAGVIIVNPHNPLGVVFPPEDVVTLCNWAASKNLHVVIDEVFANCVFDKSSKFRPFLSYRHRVHRPENVAWLWSVSKDFGLPGLKYAVIHSANEGLRRAALKLQLYHPCSPFVQDFAVKLLSDSEWLREFHTEVTKRMAIHYRYTVENLKRLEIPFVPAQAGIFVFADFSKYSKSNDTIGELELFERLASAGVMLTPGAHQKCHVAGWFRLVFACSKQELEEGFRRLYAYLGSHLQPVGTLHYS